MDISKKAQGLSLGFIIVAIISIAVLVIIVFAFNKNFKTFNSDITSCSSRGGICLTEDECSLNDYVRYSNTNCIDNPGEDKLCCKKVFGND